MDYQPPDIDLYIEPDRITMIPRKPPASPPPGNERNVHRFINALVIGMIALMALSLGLSVYYLINPPLATIILDAQTIHLQTRGIVSTRLFTEKQTAIGHVVTTGKGTIPAHVATGELVFYNLSLAPQTIADGTSVTGKSGIPVIVSRAITIPADQPPYNGWATVNAHTTLVGSSANIPADDINRSLATNGAVYVRNPGAFYGGADTRTYQAVAEHDITGAAAAMEARLIPALQKQLQAALSPSERMTAPTCGKTVTSSKAVGAAAASVTITVIGICTSRVYNQAALVKRAASQLAVPALFMPVGKISLMISVSKQGVRFTASQIVGYRLPLTSLSKSVAKESPATATRLLERTRGIAHVTIIWNMAPLLPGADHIRIHVIYS